MDRLSQHIIIMSVYLYHRTAATGRKQDDQRSELQIGVDKPSPCQSQRGGSQPTLKHSAEGFPETFDMFLTSRNGLGSRHGIQCSKRCRWPYGFLPPTLNQLFRGNVVVVVDNLSDRTPEEVHRQSCSASQIYLVLTPKVEIHARDA